jgi:hypothetical protein
MKQFPFLAGQQEDGQERSDDDDCGKEDAPGHLFAGPFDDRHPFREGDTIVIVSFRPGIFKCHNYDLLGE